jgi:hypothetical protein
VSQTKPDYFCLNESYLSYNVATIFSLLLFSNVENCHNLSLFARAWQQRQQTKVQLLPVIIFLNFSFFDRYSISFTAAEESLRQIQKSDFIQLKSFIKPPLACLAILEGVGILLDPPKKRWEWTDDKNLTAGSKDEFLERLFKLDKDNINDKQLEKLNSILARDDCQPANLAKVSLLCSKLGLWLRAIVAYATQQRQEAQK